MASPPVHASVSIFERPADAEAAFDTLRDLQRQGSIDAFDAAVVVHHPTDGVRMHRREPPTRRGAWTGLATGALVGLLLPAAALPLTAALGAGLGGVMAHLARGIPRAALDDLGWALDDGEAALVVLAGAPLGDAAAAALHQASASRERALRVDAHALRDLIDDALSAAWAHDAERDPRVGIPA